MWTNFINFDGEVCRNLRKSYFRILAYYNKNNFV